MSLFITLLLGLSSAHAILAKNPLQPSLRFQCVEALSTPAQTQAGIIEFHTSGRNNEMEEGLRIDAQIITDIAHDLGLATPPHQILFVPDEQLNVMAALGGQPSPTWMSGHSISTSMGRVLGVMEFVTPGCPTCRSFYSDKTPRLLQRGVLMHVMGHNDMANTSRLILDRMVDPPRDGLLLAKKIDEAYNKYDHDEVSLFVQHLNSLDQIQDYTYGAVELPEKFVIDKNHNKITQDLRWAQTANALQALVHQLGEGAPAWKQEILELYEKVQRVYPAYANSKVMNEGWATLMEYLVARHAPGSWRTTNDIIEYASMMGSVAYPSLTNPYWLGLMGWWNLYSQFNRQAQIRGLDPKEQDRKFIAWARATYATMTDYEWLQASIDQEFCDRWRLFIYRETAREEMDRTIPPDKQKFIALSRDPRRIFKYLIRKIVDRSRQIPRIVLHNPQATDPSRLDFSHELQHDLALEPYSAVKTMFVMAQVFNKRITLNAHLAPKWGAKGGDLRRLLLAFFLGDDDDSQYAEMIRDWINSMSDEQVLRYCQMNGIEGFNTHHPVLVHMEVSPDGKFQASWPEGSPEGSPPLTKLIAAGEAAIDSYKADMLANLDTELARAQRKKWQAPSMKAADFVTDPSMEIVQYAPYASQALEELIHMIEWRFPQAFKSAVNSGTITPGGRGVRLRVLPEIPEFGYDREHYNWVLRSLPKGPIDGRSQFDPEAWGLDDNGSILTAGEKLPGDRFAGPPKGKGKGEAEEGEGDEDGEGDGDPSDNDGREPNPGQGGVGASDIEIPLELYGKLLAEELELPNLRRTEGKSEEMRRIHRGKVHKSAGHMLWHEIAVEAMNTARAVRKVNHQPYGPEVNPILLVKEGMKYIDPSSYVVRGHAEIPRPDFDAVIVINVDVTGSMMGERVKMAKNLIFNIKALLAAVYKNVKIHYVAFDSTAEEVSEKRVWTIWKGGGTAYAPALVEDQRILANYPTSRWNKFVLTIGDGETADGEAFVEELRKMSPELQYAGVAITTNGGYRGYEHFMEQVIGFKSTWPWIGSTVLTHESQIMAGIKELFPKDPLKK